MEFWSYSSKHWNSYRILPNSGFLGLLLYTLEFWPHPSKHWNSGPILINTAILILSFHCKHWTSSFICPNIWILALSLYTLEFWPPTSFLILGFRLYFDNHRNSGPILTNTGIPISSLPLQTLKFWHYPF